MEKLSPRIRLLLRQANKVTESGKRSAATKLYLQVIEEAPETVDAWIGLAGVYRDPAESEAALDKALELDPENARARRELAILHGEIPDEPEPQEVVDTSGEAQTVDTSGEAQTVETSGEAQTVETSGEAQTVETSGEAQTVETSGEAQTVETETMDTVEAVSPTAEPQAVAVQTNTQKAEIQHTHESEDNALIEEDEHDLEYVGEVLYCANHPRRETHLRCNRCGKPICTSCAKRTPVGYRCPECIREHEEIFYTATVRDYLLAVLIALPLSLIAGYIATLVGFFVIFLAAAAGSLIGRLVFRAVGRRRGRWMPQLVGVIVVIGGIFPAAPYLLGILFGSFGLSFGLLWTAIYVVMASGAAYYQMR